MPIRITRWSSMGRGVNKIVSFGNEPAPISEVVIEEIRGRVDATGIVKMKFDLRPNDPVRVKSGPFPGFSGNIRKMDPGKGTGADPFEFDWLSAPDRAALSMIEKVA